MGASADVDPYGVLPDNFVSRWDDEVDRDINTVQQALRAAERAGSSTPDSELRDELCPFCGSHRVYTKGASKESQPHRRPEDHKCRTCNAHFDIPGDEDTIPMTDDRTNAFHWVESDDLLNHEQRGFTPVLRGVDDETLTELILRLYQPWDDDAGPSYRQLQQIIPHSRGWIGDRVRAWRAGEHRELVPAPDRQIDAPSDDANATAGADGAQTASTLERLS